MEYHSNLNDTNNNNNRQRPYIPPPQTPNYHHNHQQSHGFSSAIYPNIGQSGQPVIPPPARPAQPPPFHFNNSSSIPPLSSCQSGQPVIPSPARAAPPPYHHSSSSIPPFSSSGPGIGFQFKPEYDRVPPSIMSSPNSSVFNLRSTLEKEKLNAKNFLDWERNLRIVLRCEGKEYVLDTPIPGELPPSATQFEKSARQSIIDDSILVTCLMLSCMESDFQKRFDGMNAYNIIQELKSVYKQNSRLERFELNRKIFNCKLKKGEPVGPHVYTMIGYFQEMEKLGFSYPLELSTDIIMSSLHEGFNTFLGYFYMQDGKASLQELHGMLVQAERMIPRDSQQVGTDLTPVKKTTQFKKDGKAAKKEKEKAKKAKVASEHEHKCFHCNEIGHWKRNCPKFLDEMKVSSS